MIVVVDASVLVAELLRKRGRELFDRPDLTCVVAKDQWDEAEHELEKRLQIMVDRKLLTDERAQDLREGVQRIINDHVIEVMPRASYEYRKTEARRRVPRDADDWPPVALALALDAGYLGDFSCRTHTNSYPEYCDMDINPNNYEGTTRERFIAILTSLEPRDQARVLKGVIERFPPDKGPETRQPAHAEVLSLIERLEASPLVTAHTPQITSDVVLRALTKAAIQLPTPERALPAVRRRL